MCVCVFHLKTTGTPYVVRKKGSVLLWPAVYLVPVLDHSGRLRRFHAARAAPLCAKALWVSRSASMALVGCCSPPHVRRSTRLLRRRHGGAWSSLVVVQKLRRMLVFVLVVSAHRGTSHEAGACLGYKRS